MSTRILLGGVLGGLVIFFVSAFTHTVLNWGGRAIDKLPEEEEFTRAFSKQNAAAGMYAFPHVAHDATKKEQELLNEVYKKGPSGMVIVMPTGEEIMSNQTLGKELATNILGALLMAWIVSQFAPEKSFAVRLLAVIAMGMFSWLAIDASYLIWYRFSQAFITDALFNSLLENAAAGVIIAAIVRHKAEVKA